ncbi:MAG TPA: uroporphyrinogen-III synthase, partial [Kofleriaceae bacterium]
ALPEVWAVGPATARALADAGIPARLPAGARDGASLAAAVIADRALRGRRVLVPRAEAGRDELVDALRAAGAEVDAVAAYRTVAAPGDHPAIAHGLALLRAGDAAVCAMFAPSQVAALVDLLGPLAALATRFAAIGQTTAAALRAAGVTRLVVADAATPERLANAVAAVYPLRS